MKKILMLLILFAGIKTAAAQQPPYWKEIQEFKKLDSLLPVPTMHPIVFAGSSSFTMWKKVNEDFPGFPILNRAFGGSTLPDVIRYADEVIIKHMPKQVVIYCGENDFAADTGLMPQQVTERFIQLFKIIRNKLPYARITYVSMKPSPSRVHLVAKYNVANVMIREFLKKKKRTDFINVYHAMLNSDGTPMADIFLADNLHMNAKGYEIWKRIIAPYLKK